MIFIGVKRKKNSSVRGNPSFREELAMGERLEMEHTSDPAEARKIALDHLREDHHYYSKLANCMPRVKKELRAAGLKVNPRLHENSQPGDAYRGYTITRERVRSAETGQRLYVIRDPDDDNRRVGRADSRQEARDMIDRWEDAAVGWLGGGQHPRYRRRLFRALSRTPRRNPYTIRDGAGRVWNGMEWTMGQGQIYDHVRDMPRDLPWGNGMLIVRDSDNVAHFVDHEGEMRAWGEPFGMMDEYARQPYRRRNPQPVVNVAPSLADAYERFHGVAPQRATDIARAWVPGPLVYLGPSVDVSYQIVDSKSSKEKGVVYVHESKDGVKIYCRPDFAPGAKPTKHFKNFPKDLWVLGSFPGFTVKGPEGDVEIKGSTRKKMCTNAKGTMLVVVDDKGVLFVIKGGQMKVTDWIRN